MTVRASRSPSPDRLTTSIKGDFPSKREILQSFFPDVTERRKAIYSSANELKEELIAFQDEQSPGYFVKFRNKHHNEHLDDIVRNVYEKNKIL